MSQSLELEQLDTRVASATHAETANGDDPFAKVKGFVSDENVNHMVFCDKELSENRMGKKARLVDLEKATSCIDTEAPKSA